MSGPLRNSEKTVNGFIGKLKGAAAALGLAFSFQKVIDETQEAQAALAQLGVAYQNAGESARRSKEEILAFSDATQRSSAFSDEAVTRAQTALLRFGRVTGNVFDRARSDVLDVASALNIDLETAAFSVGRALESPSQGLRQLRSLGIIFTESQQRLIQSLEDTGQSAKAQEIVLSALEDRFSGAASAARNTLGGALSGLKNAFGDLFEATDEGASAAAEGVNALSDAISDPAFKTAVNGALAELLDWVRAFIHDVALAAEGWAFLNELAFKAQGAVLPDTPFENMLDKQAEIADKLTRALEARERLVRTGQTGTGSIISLKDLDKQIADLRKEMRDVEHDLQNIRQAPGTGRPGEDFLRAGGPGSHDSRKITSGGTFVSEAEFQRNLEDARRAANGKIEEVTIKQRKAELEGLTKLLAQFEQDTKLTEDKIYADYLETTTKIKELQKAGIIDAEETARRLSNARIKFENDILIDPVKITQSKVVVQQVLSEQQRAVDKFVDTLSTGLDNLARSGELTGRSILKYLLSAFQAQVLKDAIAGLSSYLKTALGGTGGSSSSALGSFLSGLFGSFGHAAGGGRGGVRWVGEDGPELDTGGGNIMNRRQLQFAMGGGGGGGVVVTNNNVFNVSGTDPATTAQYIEARLQIQQRRQLEQWNRLLKDNYGRGLR